MIDSDERQLIVIRYSRWPYWICACGSIIIAPSLLVVWRHFVKDADKDSIRRRFIFSFPERQQAIRSMHKIKTALSEIISGFFFIAVFIRNAHNGHRHRYSVTWDSDLPRQRKPEDHLMFYDKEDSSECWNSASLEPIRTGSYSLVTISQYFHFFKHIPHSSHSFN